MSSRAPSSSPSTPPHQQRKSSTAVSPLLVPLLIATLALALRLWNVTWALPNATRAFSFHPDESTVVSASMDVDPFRLAFDPHFYAYGDLPLLLNGVMIDLGRLAGLVGPGPAPPIPSAGALLAARFVTVLLGAGTVLFLFGAGRLLYNRAAGLIAATLYGLAPLAVQHGHWATVDVPATFFISGALFFAARAASSEARRFDLVWCGVWTGLAGAAKYNGILVGLAGVVAWWVRRDLTPRHPLRGYLALPAARSSLGEGELESEEKGFAASPKAPLSQRGTSGRERGVGGVRFLLAALLALLLACPTLLLNPRGVLEGIAKESAHVRTGHGETFVGTGSGFLYHISYNLSWGLTLPLLGVVLAGVVGVVVRRSRADGILAAFALPYYLLIGLATVKFARYTLPLFPPLFLWTGALVVSLWKWRRPAGLVAGGLLALAAAWALLFSLAMDTTMGQPDPRDEAAAYLKSLPNVQTVGFARGPWFYSPPLGPLFGAPVPYIAQKSALESPTVPRSIPCLIPDPNGSGQIVPIEWDRDLLHQTDPDAVSTNEFDYSDAQRVRQPDALAWIADVEARYPNRRVFGQPMQVFGIPFTKLDTKRGLPTQNLPEDMRYTNPVEVIFTK